MRVFLHSLDDSNFLSFLPRDATQSVVMRFHVVCLSVMIRYRDHIGWNSSKIISRPNSLRLMHSLTPTWAIWCNGNTPKIGGWNESCRISETVQDRTKVTITH